MSWDNEDEPDVAGDLFVSFVESFTPYSTQDARRMLEEHPEECRENAIKVFNNFDEILESSYNDREASD